MNRFRKAGVAEIIRSHQKDDNFLQYLRSLVADVFQSITGPQIWLRWRNHLDMLSDLVYFCLTTCSDLQTIGEEYVNVIQTDGTLRALPSKWRRALMVVLQVCTPYLLKSALRKVEHILTSSASFHLSHQSREAILHILPLVEKSATILHRLHLAVFYINGIHYHLAKRIAGIHYIQYMPKEPSASTMRPFQILGYLSIAQLVCSVFIHIVSLIITIRQQKISSTKDLLRSRSESDVSTVQPHEKCPMCLSQRQQSTLTPCGHLFCWHCIHEWCQTKQECPLCRENLTPNRLIALQNFDPILIK